MIRYVPNAERRNAPFIRSAQIVNSSVRVRPNYHIKLASSLILQDSLTRTVTVFGTAKMYLTDLTRNSFQSGISATKVPIISTLLDEVC
jgi:hypothetical protein